MGDRRLMARYAPQKILPNRLVERGRKLYVISDFNLIEKRVRGHTAIPLDVNKLTPKLSMTPWMVHSVKRLISPSWVLISFVARHLMPFWLRLIICECLLPNQLSAVTCSNFDRWQFNAT